MKVLTPILIFVLSALSACSDAAAPSSAGEGTYRLVRVDDRVLPTAAPCGRFQIVSGRIVLGPDRDASYALHYKELGTWRDVHYVGEGRFTERSGQIALVITGSWSNGVGVYRSTIEVERNGADLTRRGVGAECDANSIEVYKR